MAAERLGQWRKGLSSMSLPRWSKPTVGASKKVKPTHAADPADIEMELADFQGMPRCYDSGSDSEDLLTSNMSISSSQTSTCTSLHAVQPATKSQLLQRSPIDTDSFVDTS